MLMGALAASVWAATAVAAPAAIEQRSSLGLSYDANTRGAVPIPPAERMLQSVVASPWFKVSDKSLSLEGAIFDRSGNLLFCDVTGRRVLRLTPDKQLSVVTTLETLSPSGLALNKDGRLFIAAMDLVNSKGAIVAVQSDGAGLQTILAPEAGYLPNDLVFDAHGGFYFSDFKGTATEPEGGVFYIAPKSSTVTPVIPHLAMANGVALSPDGKVLWATELSRNLLHRVELADATTIASVGSAVAYHFVGPAPDSMRVDADSNVYVAMYNQGRVMAFNPKGIPIGQVLLPGRDQGHNLVSTSLAIRPGTTEMYVVAGNAPTGLGAYVFESEVFGKGLPPVH